MANPANLIPASDPRGHKLTVEEASKGGIASGKARAKKKTWKELLDIFGQKGAKSKKMKELMKELGIPEDEQTSDAAKMFNLDLRSQSGDPKALETEAKIRGEFAPVKNVNENHNLEYKPLVNLTERKKNGEG